MKTYRPPYPGAPTRERQFRIYLFSSSTGASSRPDDLIFQASKLVQSSSYFDETIQRYLSARGERMPTVITVDVGHADVGCVEDLLRRWLNHPELPAPAAFHGAFRRAQRLFACEIAHPSLAGAVRQYQALFVLCPKRQWDMRNWLHDRIMRLVMEMRDRDDGVLTVWREMMGSDEMGQGRGELEEQLVLEVLGWYVYGLRAGDMQQMKAAYVRFGGDTSPLAREFLKVWSHTRRTGMEWAGRVQFGCG